jgi:CRISPR-associated Csx2 family protein
MHVLLTALGGQARPTIYCLGESTAEARLAPLALLAMLDSDVRPDRVLALVTRGAKEATWPVFVDGVKGLVDIVPQPIDIPDGRDAVEVAEILAKVALEVPVECELTLDVTQGFRHFPFIVYALTLYLQSLRGIQVRGAYYGMVEGTWSEGEPRPLVDLRPLLELPEWFYAVRVFRDFGTARQIADLLQPFPPQLREAAVAADHDRALHRQAREAQELVELLQRLSFAHEAALPLELGRCATHLSSSVRKVLPETLGRQLPLAKELAEIVAAAAKPSAFATPPAFRGKWKTHVALSEAELARQAMIIDQYLVRNQVPLAIGLMREWVISWAMYQTGKYSGWLSYTARKPFERRLGALAAFCRGGWPQGIEPTREQQAFGQFWSQLSDELRNALHHHAMREDAIDMPPHSLQAVKEFWNKLKVGAVELPQLGGGAGKVLISPQGTRPGVLFSALHVARPDVCLVVCSEQSVATIPEATRHVGFAGQTQPLVLHDARGGFSEIKSLITAARAGLLAADEIVANMTGGTTLIGIVVQQLVEASERLDRPTRRFALIDRRPPYEQDAEPYVLGDFQWLDDE